MSDTDPIPALILAVRQGDVAEVKRLLDSGAETYFRDARGRTPLMEAAQERSRVEVLRLLIEAGARLDDQDPDGLTALHHATKWGVFDAAEALLAAGAPTDVPDREGLTPLMHGLQFCAFSGFQGVLDRLLALGPIDAQDTRGNTALMWAVQKGDTSAVRALSAAGARTDLRNDAGVSLREVARDGLCTPLVLAALREGYGFDIGDDADAAWTLPQGTRVCGCTSHSETPKSIAFVYILDEITGDHVGEFSCACVRCGRRWCVEEDPITYHYPTYQWHDMTRPDQVTRPSVASSLVASLDRPRDHNDDSPFYREFEQGDDVLKARVIHAERILLNVGSAPEQESAMRFFGIFGMPEVVRRGLVARYRTEEWDSSHAFAYLFDSLGPALSAGEVSSLRRLYFAAPDRHQRLVGLLLRHDADGAVWRAFAAGVEKLDDPDGIARAYDAVLSDPDRTREFFALIAAKPWRLVQGLTAFDSARHRLLAARRWRAIRIGGWALAAFVAAAALLALLLWRGGPP